MTNLKLILRTYSALRQMSPDDIALLETLRALNDNDRELLVETMTDKPATKKASRKSSKKSERASGMAAQLNKSLGQQRAVTTKDDNYDPEVERCTFLRDDGRVCFLLPDHNVHHMKSAQGFHPFVSAAPPAPNQSPANGGAGSITPNSVDGTDDAGIVHRGASGGD